MCPRDTKKQDSSILEATTTADESLVVTSSSHKKVLTASHDMCHYCFDIVIQELTTKSTRTTTDSKKHGPSNNIIATNNSMLAIDEIIPSLDASCPLFVTWEKRVMNKKRQKQSEEEESNNHYELRGCIGTLAPRPLVTAMQEYAILSAFRDGRFEPMRPHEIPSLRVAVSLLVHYEDCKDVYDWTVGVHGILLKFKFDKTHYNATYLPEVAHEQGWTQEETVSSLIRKSGYYGNPLDILNPHNESLQCTRYQSSKKWLTYDEYVHRCSLSSNNKSQPKQAAATFIASTIEDDTDNNTYGNSSKRGWRSLFPF